MLLGQGRAQPIHSPPGRPAELCQLCLTACYDHHGLVRFGMCHPTTLGTMVRAGAPHLISVCPVLWRGGAVVVEWAGWSTGI
jgi:hypothetical protein